MTYTVAVVASALLLVGLSDAYLPSTSSRSSFVGSRSLLHAGSAGATMRMDMESVSIDAATRYNLEQLLQKECQVVTPKFQTIREAEAAHGMPWKTSIDPVAFAPGEDLLYMPFWEWQMKFMEENLTDLRVEPCSNGKTDFSFVENAKKKARMVNVCASSKEYRKIRMTYYDAGENCQVFNAVWYPDPAYNLPVLGIDVLAFNRKKYLAIVDFQPLHEVESDHAATFEDILMPIKEKYENLKGRMSSKFYDETKFFSQQMLFARFEKEEIIHNELFPAFQQYVAEHLNLIKSVEADPQGIQAVMERHKAYDVYSADRDPATALFAAMFGAEWAGDFVHDFLFSMSERKEGAVVPPMPFMGGGGGNPHAAGGGRPSNGGGNPFAAQQPPQQATPAVHEGAPVRRR